MHNPENLVRGGQLWRFFFLLDEESQDQNTTNYGPLSARQRNTIEMANWYPMVHIQEEIRERSGLVEGPRVRASPTSLRCVLEQEHLS